MMASVKQSENLPINFPFSDAGGEAARTIRKVQRRYDLVPFEVRVMASAEGWHMVRRKGAAPFLVKDSDLCD